MPVIMGEINAIIDDVLRIGMPADEQKDPTGLYAVPEVRALRIAIADLQDEKQRAESELADAKKMIAKLRDLIYGLAGCVDALKDAIADPGPDGLFREWIVRDARELEADAEMVIDGIDID